jgi:hypothetical protein
MIATANGRPISIPGFLHPGNQPDRRNPYALVTNLTRHKVIGETDATNAAIL